MIETLANLAGILGGLAVIATFFAWLWKHFKKRHRIARTPSETRTPRSQPSPANDPHEAHHFSSAERDILTAAADTGEIRILTVDAFGDWVRCGGKTDFFEQSDPAYNAKYLEAFERLRSRNLVRHQGGILYRLTGTGFAIARDLKENQTPSTDSLELPPEATDPAYRDIIRQHLAMTLKRAPTAHEVDEVLAKTIISRGVDHVTAEDIAEFEKK